MRVLVLPCSAYLAHLLRPLEVAADLAADGAEILVAGQGRHFAQAARAGFAVADAVEPLSEVMRAGVTRRDVPDFGDESALRAQVEARLAIIRAWRPDVVLSDFLPAARIAATVAGVRHVAIVNGVMSRLRRHPVYTVPAPAAWVVGLENLGMGWMWRCARRVAAAYGIRGLSGHDLLAGADATLVADWPDFAPLRPDRRTDGRSSGDGLPAGWSMIGALVHRGDGRIPDAWRDQDATRPIVVISEGSGGAGMAERLAEVLAGTCHIRRVGLDPGTNTLIDGLAAARGAAAVICHGGSGTVQQALLSGVPVIAIPSHVEQRWHARRAAALGLGFIASSAALRRDPSRIRLDLDRCLDPSWRDGFRGRLAAVVGGATADDAPRRAARAVWRVVGGRPETVAEMAMALA